MRRVSVHRDRLARWLAGFDERHGRANVEVAADRVSLTAPDGATATIAVPFPPLETRTLDGLLDHLATPRRIGVLLARKGGYAVGIVDGSALVASKTGSAYVQGRTKAGGWSQQRYARRRDNQAAKAWASAAQQAAKLFDGAGLGRLVTGGDRTSVGAVLDDPILRRLDLPRPVFLGPTEDPRQRVLVAFLDVIDSVTIELNDLA